MTVLTTNIQTGFLHFLSKGLDNSISNYIIIFLLSHENFTNKKNHHQNYSDLTPSSLFTTSLVASNSPYPLHHPKGKIKLLKGLLVCLLTPLALLDILEVDSSRVEAADETDPGTESLTTHLAHDQLEWPHANTATTVRNTFLGITTGVERGS